MLDITKPSKRRYNKKTKGRPRGEFIFLVDNLSVERQAQSAQEQTSILVSLGAGVESDVASGNHLRGVPIDHVSTVNPIEANDMRQKKTYMS